MTVTISRKATNCLFDSAIITLVTCFGLGVLSALIATSVKFAQASAQDRYDIMVAEQGQAINCILLDKTRMDTGYPSSRTIKAWLATYTALELPYLPQQQEVWWWQYDGVENGLDLTNYTTNATIICYSLTPTEQSRLVLWRSVFSSSTALNCVSAIIPLAVVVTPSLAGMVMTYHYYLTRVISDDSDVPLLTRKV